MNIKDELPHKTVENIKNIFNKYDINSYVEPLNPSPLIWSHVIGITGLNATHSGKGITEELSLASAYAELIERISNHMLGRSPFSNLFYSNRKDFIFFPDTYKVDISEIKNINPHLKNVIKENFYLSDGYYPSDENLIDVWSNILGNELHMSPFYNVKDDKIEYLPYNMIDMLCGPNGIAAGNTYEEAIVHCICEIIERYLFLQIIDNPQSFPEIPMSYIKEHSKTSFKIINSIEKEQRYKVYVLDVSMEGKFPCCASILIDTQTQRYKFKIGCHPIFTIALERSLTEIMQRNSSIEETLSKQYEWNSLTEDTTQTYQNKCSYFRNSVGCVSNILFKTKKDFKFTEWKDQDSYSTKIWATKLMNMCLELFGNVFIRDNSWLGFPVIRMYIPNITEITVIPKGYKNTYNDEIFFLIKELPSYSKYLTKKDKEILLKHLTKKDNVFINLIADKELVISALYYELGDKENAYKHLIQTSKNTNKIRIVKRDIELELKGYSKEDRDYLLKMFFGEQLLVFLEENWRHNTFVSFFNNITNKKTKEELEQIRDDIFSFTTKLKEKISDNKLNQLIFRTILQNGDR